MYTQEEFLSKAPTYLEVPEQSKAIEEMKQIRENDSTEKDRELIEDLKEGPPNELQNQLNDESDEKGDFWEEDLDFDDKMRCPGLPILTLRVIPFRNFFRQALENSPARGYY